MGMRMVEWLECDVCQCWVELHTLWASEDFKSCLVTQQPKVGSEEVATDVADEVFRSEQVVERG